MTASFDIGKHNFAICVEDVNNNISYLDNIMLAKTKYEFKHLFACMETRTSIWNTVNTFVIESQYRDNSVAKKISFHLEAYLKTKYPTKRVVMFSSRMKTAGLKMTYAARKKHCINAATQLLQDRNDADALSIINASAKKDDLCDAIMQLQIYKSHINK